MVVYPTMSFEEQYISNKPIVYTLIVIAIFVMTTLAFLAFDCLVTRRQKAIVITARKQNALVASLFPVSLTIVNAICKAWSISLDLNCMCYFVAEIDPKEAPRRHGR